MKRSSPVTASADLRREIPASRSGRIDRVRAALSSLREEERRLTRLGLEAPLRRCREQRRYWEFLAALFPDRGPAIVPGPRRKRAQYRPAPSR